MAYPDVMKPVILNASTQVVVSTDFFLRDICFISLGDTNLTENTIAQIDETSYLDIFESGTTTSNETYKRILSFYKYATNKPCYIMELGGVSITALENNYSNLLTYAKTLKGEAGETFSTNAFYAYLYEQFKEGDDSTELDSAKEFLTNEGVFDSDTYQEYLTNNEATDDFDTLKTYASTELNPSVSLDTTNSTYLVYLAENNSAFMAYLTLENLQTYLATLTIGYTAEAYTTWLSDEGSSDLVSTNNKVSMLMENINEGAIKCYWYVTPNKFRDNAEFVAFATGFSGETDYTYFLISVPTTENPNDTDSVWYNYAGAKCIIGVYDNCALSSNSLIGALAGKFASSIYDISLTQKASPFNYKTLSGIAFSPIASTTRDIITQAALNFGGTLASNYVLLNGRCADGRGIDYWYQWDLTAYYLDLQIITLLLNGVNNPNYAIRYNQNGIDTIKANVESVLDKMVNYGCITEYGTSLDSNTNAIENPNYVYAIDYQTYISSNPEDYNNEVYAGISFFARIEKYIRQVQLSITLG